MRPGLAPVVTALKQLGETGMKTMMDTISELGKFKTLWKAIRSSDLLMVLNGRGPFTLFAPTDEAFAHLYSEILEVLFRDKIKLSDVLTDHVIPEYITIEDALNRHAIQTASGRTLKFFQKENIIKVDQAHLLATDIVCSNGIVHVVDAVLMPEEFSTTVQQT
jgi:transforming growth factor-beta-induced protein